MPQRPNLRTALPRRRRADGGMAAFDRLPGPLRAWLAAARLPWGTGSAMRAYRRALAETGAPAAALARLSAIEARLLAADARLVWGPDYPDGPGGAAVPGAATGGA